MREWVPSTFLPLNDYSSMYNKSISLIPVCSLYLPYFPYALHLWHKQFDLQIWVISLNFLISTMNKNMLIIYKSIILWVKGVKLLGYFLSYPFHRRWTNVRGLAFVCFLGVLRSFLSGNQFFSCLEIAVLNRLQHFFLLFVLWFVGSAIFFELIAALASAFLFMISPTIPSLCANTLIFFHRSHVQASFGWEGQEMWDYLLSAGDEHCRPR